MGPRRWPASPSARARSTPRRLGRAAGAGGDRDAAHHRALAAASRSRNASHGETLSEVDQLQTQNAMLDIIARSVDVPLAFQALAGSASRGSCRAIASAWRCCRRTARSSRPTPRACTKKSGARGRGPRSSSRSSAPILGQVVRSREPLIIADIRPRRADFLDANILMTSGFESALLVPLVSRGRAVGTLNVVSRRPGSVHAAARRRAAADRRDPRRRLGRAAAAHDASASTGRWRSCRS